MKNFVNPLMHFERFWRIGERIVLTTAFMVVGGTVGYVSLHLFA